MEQRKLKELLEEAAKPECTWQRRNEIQCLLGAATPAMRDDGVYEIEGRGAGMHTVLEHLYVDTIKNKPEILPSLFPFFAVICGDRDKEMIVAEIDWSLVQ